MKNSILRFALLIMISLPLMSVSQKNPIDALFSKYAGEDCFTSVNISSEMFGLFANIEDVDDEEFKEFQEVISKLEGLKILTFTPGAACKGVDFYQEILDTYPMDEYTELMEVLEKDEVVKFYVKKENGKIPEMIMIARECDEIVLLSLFGDLDLSFISKLSKSMNIDGLENLEKMEDEEENEDKD